MPQMHARDLPVLGFFLPEGSKCGKLVSWSFAPTLCFAIAFGAAAHAQSIRANK